MCINPNYLQTFIIFSPPAHIIDNITQLNHYVLNTRPFHRSIHHDCIKWLLTPSAYLLRSHNNYEPSKFHVILYTHSGSNRNSLLSSFVHRVEHTQKTISFSLAYSLLHLIYTYYVRSFTQTATARQLSPGARRSPTDLRASKSEANLNSEVASERAFGVKIAWELARYNHWVNIRRTLWLFARVVCVCR